MSYAAALRRTRCTQGAKLRRVARGRATSPFRRRARSGFRQTPLRAGVRRPPVASRRLQPSSLRVLPSSRLGYMRHEIRECGQPASRFRYRARQRRSTIVRGLLICGRVHQCVDGMRYGDMDPSARKCRDDVSFVLIFRKNHNGAHPLPACSNERLGGDGEPVYAEPASRSADHPRMGRIAQVRWRPRAEGTRSIDHDDAPCVRTCR